MVQVHLHILKWIGNLLKFGLNNTEGLHKLLTDIQALKCERVRVAAC